MKAIKNFTAGFLLFSGCSPVNYCVAQNTLDIQKLRIRNDSAYYNSVPFTGKAVRYAMDTKLKPTVKKLRTDTVYWAEAEYGYKNGLIQKQTVYFSENKKKLEIDFVTGDYKEWYKSAGTKAKVEGNMKAKVRNGKWIFFHKNGKISAEGHYLNGRETGTWTYYHSNGQKSAEGNFVDGKQDGKWTYWYKDGKVSSENEIQKLSPEKRKQNKKVLEAFLFPLYLMK